MTTTTPERRCPDGYVITKVPLHSVGFFDVKEIRSRIAGPEASRYAGYCELISNGHFANGVPIVYRIPNGKMFAADLRHTDLVLWAWRNTKPHPMIDQHVANPNIPVKVIEIANRADVPAQRALYLEKTS
jgi:hypothetical protein